MTVSIRPLKIEDAYTSVKWRNDSSVFQYTGNTYNHEITIESELAWIERVINKKEDYRCAIEVNGTYVGNIYLTDIHDGEAEYHIFIGDKAYWGKGVAKEASKQILTYAKEKLNLHAVILEVRRENVRAIELYKAVGFQFIKAEGDKWIMRVDINQKKPLVAIHCLVYNHEPYLRDCFEGFVMQKTNFRFVAVVHEDCSTDNSAAIIREYAEKYPEIFRPIFETENQWGKHDGSINTIMNDAIDATGAKYVAMCEGDDYWIDPLKIQKQVDFLDLHPDVGMCFTDFDVFFVKSRKYYHSVLKNYPEKYCSVYETLDKWLLGQYYVGPMTWMVRSKLWKACPKINSIDGTFVQFAHFYASSKVFCLKDETTAVYRCHDGSATHQLTAKKQYEREKGIFEVKLALLELYRDKISDYDSTLFGIKKNFYSTLLLILNNGDKNEIENARLILGKKKSLKQKIIFMIYRIPFGLEFLMYIRTHIREIKENKYL